MAKINKINLVILGAGYMAEEYIKVINSQKKLNILGIYSRTKKKAKTLAKKYNIKKTFNSIKEIKNLKELDGIIISVSAENINKVCKTFIKTKFKILVDKPVGLNFYESKKLISQAIKFKQKIFVALNRRYFDSTLDLKRQIKKEKGMRLVEVFDSQNKNTFKRLKKNPRVINSLMYANSVHLIDYFNIFCRGKIKKVISIKSQANNPSIIVSKIVFKSGDIGIYHATWNRKTRWKIKVTVSNRKEWVLQPLETLKCFNVENNKLRFAKSYLSKFKDGLKNMINDYQKELLKKKNNLIPLKKHLTTVDLIRKIYGH